MNNIKLGNLLTNREVPILEVLVGDDKYYLAPFKGHKFQISITEDGEWDMASTDVVGFGNLVSMIRNFKSSDSISSIYNSNKYYKVEAKSGNVLYSILKAYATECLSNMCYRKEALLNMNMEFDDCMEEFIIATIEWLIKEVK